MLVQAQPNLKLVSDPSESDGTETQLKIAGRRPVLACTMYCIKARKERHRERPEVQGEAHRRCTPIGYSCIVSRQRKKRAWGAYGAFACISPVKSLVTFRPVGVRQVGHPA